jgi:hypothetical protein
MAFFSLFQWSWTPSLLHWLILNTIYSYCFKWCTAGLCWQSDCCAVCMFFTSFHCKKDHLFYKSICHFLDYLKFFRSILGDLHCLKGSYFFFRILVQLHCLCPDPFPKPFSQSRKTVNLRPGQIPGEGQVQLHQGHKVRRSHCQQFCAHVSTLLEWVHTYTFLIKRNCLAKIFSVSGFGTRGSLIPTIWGLIWDYTFHLGRPPPAPCHPSPGRCVLLPGCRGPTFGRQQQLSGPANEFGLQNFLTTWVKEL